MCAMTLKSEQNVTHVPVSWIYGIDLTIMIVVPSYYIVFLKLNCYDDNESGEVIME
jgi:hypothetical protein